jgi:hypothetical protein
VVSGGTAKGLQQQRGNVSRASIAYRYSVPISSLVHNYFNHWLSYKFWCLMMKKKKKKKREEKGERKG